MLLLHFIAMLDLKDNNSELPILVLSNSVESNVFQFTTTSYNIEYLTICIYLIPILCILCVDQVGNKKHQHLLVHL